MAAGRVGTGNESRKSEKSVYRNIAGRDKNLESTNEDALSFVGRLHLRDVDLISSDDAAVSSSAAEFAVRIAQIFFPTPRGINVPTQEKSPCAISKHRYPIGEGKP